ncbi:complement C4-B [Colossoma macropomum]|uniref:complement C4-B n=1 Tax=Colossoma macropomum TaxID=42526 RepID=UPI0018653ABB|nr:complement C4-B [Colossoma macropomum]
MGSVLYLLLCLTFTAQLVSAQRFLVTAPSVFHVGVTEQVLVQVGDVPVSVTCYLEQEVKRVRMSESETISITQKGQIGKLGLKVPAEKVAELTSADGETPYLNLVCDVGERRRQITRVLVSPHRGYIFIQTDQPMYNPTQTVQYRIFVLDHAMRPTSDMIFVHIVNAEGNTIKKVQYKVRDGIFSKSFHIPDLSQPGVWKIKAHYKGDEKSASVREFKVQKFVLPSFGVSILPESGYLLVNAGHFKFSVGASYSYGKTISGGFHCRFGVRTGSDDITFIKGLEKTGPIRDGKADVTLSLSDVRQKLQNTTLQRLAEGGARFYISVTVTDKISGEVQETEMFLPIVSQPYLVDLSRTRSHYIPQMPLDVVVVVRTPNGLPAKGVPVKTDVSNTVEKSFVKNTDDEGIATHPFNLVQRPSSITVEVTVDGVKSTKTIRPSTSASSSFLFISVNNKVFSPGNILNVAFNVVNGNPADKYIYYMVVSKGVLVDSGSQKAGDLTRVDIPIKAEMTPSFRLIGYYYHSNGEIVADSVWVDVKDSCEGKIEVKEADQRNYYGPGDFIKLNIDVGTQSKVKVALLAVDKAIYALNAQNKLTPKQVFSSMQSYDLGCSYGGGKDTAAVFNDAGLTFISHSETVKTQMRKGLSCESGFRRQRRAIDLQKEMTKKESEFQDAALQKCCRHGLTLIPMQLTCEERKKRIGKTESQACVDAFLKCCQFAMRLREKKRQEDIRSSHGRTASAADFEDFFDNEVQYIRQSFPPSFGFKEIEVKGKAEHNIAAPDSITTWEIQAVSLSSSHGFCVADPLDICVFKPVFIALRLPYSVKRNEQLAIAVVIYNYGTEDKKLAVHMKPADGLCSPGSQSSASSINIAVAARSSEVVTFSAVPLKEGEIPITIHLYDQEFEMGVDAIQKTLLVLTEGVQVRKEESHLINLDGRTDKIILINAEFTNMTVPDSITNVFVKVEEDAFSVATAMPLLSPSKVESLIRAPAGCAEQTMIRLSPTALSIRYLDHSNRWMELSAGTRDTALEYVQRAYDRLLTEFRKEDGSYGAWRTHPSSHWLTALVVKVLSLVADSELVANADQQIVSQLEIRRPVNYLITTQNEDGSFSDPHPVIHREMQGGIGGLEQEVSLTAFVTIALKRSLPFLDMETDAVKGSISRATAFLLSRVDQLERPYAVAITAYCLSTCLPDKTLALSAWRKLQSLAMREGECKVWRANEDMRLVGERKNYLVPPAVALTVETTAYALLTAMAHEDTEEARAAACFLSSQENYEGGFKSTQDTIMALEALSEYAIHKPESPFSVINVQFTSSGRSEMEKLVLDKKGEKVEAELKRLVGGGITAKFSGQGEAKIKVVKAYYDLDPFTNCENLSINVTVTGKVEYTAHITETYDYYDYGKDEPSEREEEEDFPRSAIEWFDVRSRRRRDTQQRSEDTLLYKVCVSHSLRQNLSGMAIADITLLSGFEPNTDDLDKLKDLADKYISHYEVSQGRVLLYFNEIVEGDICVMFEAVQKVPIGLVQPAPATFYDYYEPDRRCSVFYAAPRRSKLVSVLCSEDVCQCAERGCFKEKKTFESLITKKDRFRHACYSPVMDYGFMVAVMSVNEASSFQLYTTTVTEVLKYSGKASVEAGDIKVFAKRKHCKSELDVGKTYLIMGNDGTSTASKGSTQYLLDSNTWVEQKPDPGKCRASNKGSYCKQFLTFLSEYQINGCSQ